MLTGLPIITPMYFNVKCHTAAVIANAMHPSVVVALPLQIMR